jgi:hypothetical protein
MKCSPIFPYYFIVHVHYMFFVSLVYGQMWQNIQTFMPPAIQDNFSAVIQFIIIHPCPPAQSWQGERPM